MTGAMRAIVVLLLAIVTNVALAVPASAHAGGGPEPTNFHTVLQSVEPRVDRVSLKVVAVGEELELVNRSAEDVVVLGYESEPYLRVGPSGSFVNTSSPAYYLNRTVTGETVPPPDADPAREPTWKKLSSDTSTRWHDHRTHWMNPDLPTQVSDAPDKRHVINPAWKVEMRHGETTIVAKGSLTWEPAPSAFPWYGLTVALAVVAMLVSMTRTKSLSAGVAAALFGMIVVRLIDLVAASSGSFGARIGDVAEAVMPGVIGVIVGIGGAWRVRLGQPDGPWYVLFGALIAAILYGITDFDVLTHSQFPTVLPKDLTRALVSVVAGVGSGCAVGSLVRIRREQTERLAETTPEHNGAGPSS